MATSRRQARQAAMLAQLLFLAASHALRPGLMLSQQRGSIQHAQKRLVPRTNAALTPRDRGARVGNRRAAGYPYRVSSKLTGARMQNPVLMVSREPAEASRWFVEVPKTVVDAADQAARSALNAARAGRRQMLVEASLPEFEPGTPQFRFIDVLTLARQVGLSLLSDSSLLPPSRPRVKLLFGGLSDATMAGGVIQYNNLPVSLLGAASAMEPTDGAFIIVMPRASSPREMKITEAQISDTLGQAGSRIVVLINPRIGASDLLARLELAYFLRPLTVSYVPSGSGTAERGLVCQLRCFPHEWSVLVDPSMGGAWEYAGRFDRCPAPVQVEAMVRDAMARSQMNRMSEEMNRAKAEEKLNEEKAEEQKANEQKAEEQEAEEQSAGAPQAGAGARVELGANEVAEGVEEREKEAAEQTEGNKEQAAAKKTGEAVDTKAKKTVATKEIHAEAGQESAKEGGKRGAKKPSGAGPKKTEGVKAKKEGVQKEVVKTESVKKEMKAKTPKKKDKVGDTEGPTDAAAAEIKASFTSKARKSGAPVKSDELEADR